VKRLDVDSAKNTDPGVTSASTYRCTWTKKLADAEIAAASEKIVASLVALGAHVREAKPAGTSLEEVFSELTRGARDTAGTNEMDADESGAA
jgi:hypothetical protein